MWYNPFYSIVQFRVTTLRYRPKEAVPIEPKQQRHISTDGVKTTTGATGQPGAPAPKNKKKPKKRRSIIGMIFSFIGCMLCLCIMAASVGGVLLSMYIVQVTADDAETLDLDNQKNRQTSIVYDINGNEYASLSRNENRIWRELSAMPENLQNAVIAIEDKNFRTEPGINLKGTIGAALNAFTGNRIWGTNRGASTLEQQLIKNLTGDNEQDNMRKVREIFRALGLDNKYSKETILEAYLNTIPLTGIIHGMEAGSIEYFGKHVEDLTLAECATLASITKNPTKYNPATNPEELIKRRNHVLYEMYTQGYITEAEFNAAKAETVTLTEKTSTTENATRSSSNSWFTDALYTQLLNQLQEDLNYTADEAKELIFSGGLRIYSTVDPKVQEGVEKTMYNEDDLIPALWHEEPVCLRDYPADSSSWDEVQYDDATGLPITKDGYAVYGQEAIPVYADEEGTTLKMGTSTDPDYPNDTTVYLCVYEKVRTQAAMAIAGLQRQHSGHRRRHRREEVRFGLQPRDLPAPDRFYDETHRCLRAGAGLQADQLFLPDPGLPVLLGGGQEGPEGSVYRRDEPLSPRLPSPAAMSGAPGPPTTAVQAVRATRCLSMTHCSSLTTQSPSGSATWSVSTTCTTLSMTRWNAAISTPRTIWTSDRWSWAPRAAA